MDYATLIVLLLGAGGIAGGLLLLLHAHMKLVQAQIMFPLHVLEGYNRAMRIKRAKGLTHSSSPAR